MNGAAVMGLAVVTSLAFLGVFFVVIGFVSVGCFIYHGDSEIYSWGESEPRTVVVWLCKKHRGDAKPFEEED